MEPPPPTVPDSAPPLDEDLPDTRERRNPGDSEPPTEVWDQPPDFPAEGFGSADRAALMAGIAVAILLLVGIAGFLLL
jgi:hypothetical protein